MNLQVDVRGFIPVKKHQGTGKVGTGINSGIVSMSQQSGKVKVS